MRRAKITVEIKFCRSEIGSYWRALSGQYAVERTSKNDAVTEIVRRVKAQGDCDDLTFVDLQEVA